MAQIARSLCQQDPKPRTGRILGYVPQTKFLGHLINPQPPQGLWFASFIFTQRDGEPRVPVVTWWSRTATRAVHGEGQEWVR